MDVEDTAPRGPQFSVSFDASLSDSAQDGRLLVLLAMNDEDEPRFQISNSADTQLVFGLNVQDWQGGTEIIVGKPGT